MSKDPVIEITDPNVEEPEVLKPEKKKTGKADRNGTGNPMKSDMGRYSLAEEGKRDEMRWSKDNKFVYHYDKRTLVLIEQDGYPDPIECFDNREKLFPKILAKEEVDRERAELGFRYIEFVASGGRTRIFLRDEKVTWSYVNFILRKSNYLWLLYRGAMAIGEDLRQKLREEEADHRAVDGVEKPVFQQKELVGHVTEYSDSLLIAQLKAGNPEKYADRKKVEHEGVVLNLTVPDLHGSQEE